ncbi:MAG: ketoacyl-ACP synthase III [Gemmatimonadetes bacterium]|nr:ketoacyl-ACP synthase III [Gemmatimonadota bacterium]
MKRPFAELVGTGRYVPEKVLSNAELEKLVDTSDEWIVERTGIRERRIAGPSETVAYMSKAAADQVLADADLGPEDLDAIILGTASPDRLLPSTACDLQALLGAKNAAAFDVSAACSGFIYGLSMAEGAGMARHVLVVGAERLSTITDYTDRATCILFGDGAGATLVRPGTDGTRGILAAYLKTDGTLAQLLYRPGGGGCHPPDQKLLTDRGYFITMAGREVFTSAVRSMTDACDQALQRAGLTGEQIDLLIPHQANIRIIEATAKHAEIPMEKVYVNIDRYGNTSAASIPIALDECVRSGRITAGMNMMLVAFGGGFTWGSLIVRW